MRQSWQQCPGGGAPQQPSMPGRASFQSTMGTLQDLRPGRLSLLSSSQPAPRVPPTLAAAMPPPVAGAEEQSGELPMIYPQLVMPVAHTRLAVPLEPLSAPTFEVDVLGLSGVPLLTVALVEEAGDRRLKISLHSVGSLLATVSSALEIFGDGSAHFGRLVREERPGAFGSAAIDGVHYALRDGRGGEPVLTLSGTRRAHSGFLRISSPSSDGRPMERATAVRRPAGRLPAEHYEVVANPNVDAVLVLACFLAVIVFESSPNSSGRPSVAVPPRLEQTSLTGIHWGLS